MRNEIGALVYNIMDLLDPCLVIKKAEAELQVLFPNSDVVIYIYHESTEVFTVGCEEPIGYTNPIIKIPKGIGLFYEAFKNKKEIIADNSIFIPFISHRGDMIGVLQVTPEDIFGRKEKNILREAAKTIATVYQNAQVHLALQETFESFVDTLSSAIDARDFVTSGHSKRTALYALELCNILNLGPTACIKVKYAALLHDIGKIGVSEKLLQKSGRLDETQFIEVKKHAIIGREILDKTKLPKEFKDIPQIVEAHHERWDGSGYPFGLKGQEIPLESRILAICDVFDALTSHRQYRPEMQFEEAIQLMLGEKGQFDQKLLKAFTKISPENLLEIHRSHRI